MRIYHYTSNDTFKKIITNKTIRFTRIDKVDDKEESMYYENKELSRTIPYISCWTKNSEEKSKMWEIYGDNYGGVRIGLTDEDIFVTYPIFFNIKNPKRRSFIKHAFYLGEDFYIHQYDNDVILYDVIYEKDVAEGHRKHSVLKNGHLRISSKISTDKGEQWLYQNESRFKINAHPFDRSTLKTTIEDFNDMDSVQQFFTILKNPMFFNATRSGEYKINTEHIDVSLNSKIFHKMEILMGKFTTEEQKTDLKNFLHKNGLLDYNLKDSSFKSEF